jgi:hypothetical protein
MEAEASRNASTMPVRNFAEVFWWNMVIFIENKPDRRKKMDTGNSQNVTMKPKKFFSARWQS